MNMPDVNCDLVILEDGDLKISLMNEESREELREALQHFGHHAIWSRILEPYAGNGSFDNATGYVGLTDSPAIADYVEYPDQGEPSVPEDANLWWFPNYAVHSELEELLEKGYTIATKANNQ